MPGEEHKSIHAAEFVLRALAEAGAERGDIVAAVGGGVVGDLAGFCAAIYQRGIRHVQVPTSLVAQVDSAYGGKTGVDLPEGKNYAGVFHQPSAVICDPAALETLPAEELAAGYAEVVKTALIAGGPLWARVRQGGEPDAEHDPRLPAHQAGGRGRGRARRGPAAGAEPRATPSATRSRPPPATRATGTARRSAIGLLVALRLSGPRRSCATRWRSCSAARGLPRHASPAPRVDDVLALVERDKKRAGGRVPFVLVEAPGEVTPRTRGGRRGAPLGGGGGPLRVRHRVEVMHGVNFDVLGARDPSTTAA